ncbi:MAG: DNA gyrase subunit A [Candidatus Anstonellales archaeon]
MTYEHMVNVEDELKKSYISYAMSIIVARALPDIRDGLKPVHRRILYSMKELNNYHNRPYIKSARVVGHALGHYHPHGDAALYEALVRMAQDFSMAYPLIDGQGNFGSIDNDPPAAMRYTEVRLSKIAEEMLADIEEDVVDFRPNFDNTTKEPVVLPSKIPQLLINGSSGIAVAMVSEIPPHNLAEVCNALIAKLNKQPNALEYIKGPDFPTGGIIQSNEGIRQLYASGKGKIVLMAKAEIDGDMIKITEIPYKVSKTKIIEEIVNAVKNGSVDGIADLHDRSDKKGLLIEIKVKRGYKPEIVLQKLYETTSLKTNYYAINIALVNGRPRLLTLEEMLDYFIDFRRQVITRRTAFRLKKAEEKLHMLKGIVMAISDIDRAIKIIKESDNASTAKKELMKAYGIDEKQADAILDIKLQRLASLEREAIKKEMLETERYVKECKDILASSEKIDNIIKQEIEEIKNNYSINRRTQILEHGIETKEYLEESLVIITNQGYIKRVNPAEIKEQHRGGVGIRISSHEQDILAMLNAMSNEKVLVFTDRGKVYSLNVSEIPIESRYAKGIFIGNLIKLESDEKLLRAIVLKPGQSVVMLTKMGIAKKVEADAFSNIRVNGIRAITFKQNDSLADVTINNNEPLLVATKKGKAILFKASDLRESGRTAIGVRAIKIGNGDNAISISSITEKSVLTITSSGYGRFTDINDYRLQKRGGSGIISIKLKGENENVVFCSGNVKKSDNLIITSKKGMVINIKCENIPEYGRNSHGVRLMKLKDDEIASVAIAFNSGVEHDAEK